MTQGEQVGTSINCELNLQHFTFPMSRLNDMRGTVMSYFKWALSSRSTRNIYARHAQL